MKVDILKEHEHEVQIARLRTKALLGKSGDLTFGVPAAQQAHQARKMLQRMRTADLERKHLFERQASGSKDTSSKADIKISSADDLDVETLLACTTESSDGPPPPPAVPEDAALSPRSPKRAFSSHDEPQPPVMKDGSGLPAARSASHRSAASHGSGRPKLVLASPEPAQLPGALEQPEDGERRPSACSRNSRNSQGSRRQSEHSTISVMSLPSFFKDQEDNGFAWATNPSESNAMAPC
eukprot:s254_g16.t1